MIQRSKTFKEQHLPTSHLGKMFFARSLQNDSNTRSCFFFTNEFLKYTLCVATFWFRWKTTVKLLTLGLVSQRNNRGYDIAKIMNCKLDYVSPTWYEIARFVFDLVHCCFVIKDPFIWYDIRVENTRIQRRTCCYCLSLWMWHEDWEKSVVRTVDDKIVVRGRHNVDKGWMAEVRNTHLCPTRKIRIVPRFHLQGWDFQSLQTLYNADRTRMLALINTLVNECVYVSSFISRSYFLSSTHFLSVCFIFLSNKSHK